MNSQRTVYAGRSRRIQGETQYIDYRVMQRQLKLEEDTGAIDPYTQHWIPE